MALDTDKFIIEIEKRVELWDTGSPNYTNKIIKQNSWTEICRLFNEAYDSMATNQQNLVLKELQRKWKSLRNSFSREQAKRKTLKSGSGRTSWKTYIYYDQLSFLSSCAANKPKTSNLIPLYDSSDENDYEDINNDFNENMSTGQISENVLRHRPAKRQKTVENQLKNEFFNSKKSLEEREHREKVYMEDPDRLFMLSLVDDLKQVPAHLKISVKSNIMQAISNGLQIQKPPGMMGNFDPYCQLNKQCRIPMSPLIHQNTEYNRPQSSFQQPSLITGHQLSPCLSNRSSTSRPTTSLSISSQSYNSSIENDYNHESNTSVWLVSRVKQSFQ